MIDDTILTQIDTFIEENVDQFLDQLARLCAQPSISAQGTGIAECADLVATLLEELDVTAEIVPSAGYPVVMGEAPGRVDKTLLFYLHYDVQPPEPLELWDSPPFRLTRRGDTFYARGVSDDKGHIIARLAALAAIRHVLGELPCHVKFFIEGEEELGSPNLPDFVSAHQGRMAADACIWEYGGVNHEGRPTFSLGMRGICYVELSVQTAAMDAHSGLGGSIFPNAAWRLVWALHSLKDPDEQVLIGGFYDDVVPPSKRDLALLAAMPEEADDLRERFGLDGFLKGLEGGAAWQRQALFEPTCTICGITTGYQGPGTKTVLPAGASAKIDFRLVPEQRPADVVAKLRAHLDAHGFDDVAVKMVAGIRPARVDPDDPFVQLAQETATEVYGAAPVVAPLVGGSGPMYPFVEVLGVPVVPAGIGYPGNQIHAPNENMRLPDFVNGIRHTARILAAFGEQGA